MHEEFNELNAKTQNIAELNVTLQMILDNLPEQSIKIIRKCVQRFRK